MPSRAFARARNACGCSRQPEGLRDLHDARRAVRSTRGTRAPSASSATRNAKSSACRSRPCSRQRTAIAECREQELERASIDGRAEDERWHVRKDGTLVFCSGVVTPLGGRRAPGLRQGRPRSDHHPRERAGAQACQQRARGAPASDARPGDAAGRAHGRRAAGQRAAPAARDRSGRRTRAHGTQHPRHGRAAAHRPETLARAP